jgi:hypothetical protein
MTCRLSVLALITLAVTTSAGCGGGALRQPIHVSPTFQFSSIDVVTVLPAVDLRADKSFSLDVDKSVRGRGAKAWKGRGYTVVNAETLGDVEMVSEEDLNDADPEWIATLGPKDSRWALVLCLVDLKTKMTFGSTGNAEVSAYLFDKTERTLVWKDKGVGRAGQGGLIGMVMKAGMDGAALDMAVGNLMGSVPKRAR